MGLISLNQPGIWIIGTLGLSISLYDVAALPLSGDIAGELKVRVSILVAPVVRGFAYLTDVMDVFAFASFTFCVSDGISFEELELA